MAKSDQECLIRHTERTYNATTLKSHVEMGLFRNNSNDYHVQALIDWDSQYFVVLETGLCLSAGT